MNLRIASCSLAVSAAFAGMMPLHAAAAPSVAFKTPTSGATISGNIYQSSACEVTGSNIDRVRFYLDSTSLNTEENAPWNCNIDTRKFADGAHTLRAVAYDKRGATASTQISLNIKNSTTTAPSTNALTITSPAAGATLSNATNTCAASAPTGTSYVRFYNDGTWLNTDTASPFTCNIDATKLASGTHTLKAISYNSSNSITGQAEISFNVASSTTGNVSPTVSITSPASGATISGTAAAFAATAADSDGTVAKVEFLLGGTLLAADTSNPYATTIDTTKFANGTYTLTVRATDNAGAVTNAQVSVNLQNSTSTTTLSAPGTGTLEIWWKAPINGATVSGLLTLDKCYVKGNGVAKVAFFLDTTALNTDTVMSDGMSCVLDTAKFANGTHTLKAVAYDSSGKTYGPEPASINIQNSTSSPTTPTNVAPTVSITSPAEGTKISGSVAFDAAASDSDGSVAKVDFLLGSTLLATDTTNSYHTTVDTTKYANGTYTLVARATDNAGAVSSAQRSVTIDNAVAAPSLPSTGTRAVPTFESVGLYWTPGTNPGSAGCKVQYRKQGDSTWKDALPMWYDARNSECRGSIVHLTPNTSYEVQLALPGQQPSRALTFKTWSESFPIARTVQVQSGSGTLNITEGGSASGYVLYTGPATLDAANGVDFNIKISAPYVIVRGLTLKGARIDAIHMVQGAHDVVIENNDISGWGRDSGNVSSEGWKIGVNKDSAIKAYCSSGPWLERTVIQRNKIHHPRYGANSWSDGHPLGPNGVYFLDCGGNHVFRYNEIYSEWGRYFMDGYGGAENFSQKGMPNSDSDLYGNRIQHAWDDAIEAEGANNNVRIWGNYFDSTATAIASTGTSQGPLYVFRNVQNRSRNKSMQTLDGDSRLYAFKTGNSSYGDGRRYVFHNTLLQAPPPAGSQYTLGAGEGLSAPGGGSALTNTVSRNNIYHIWKSWWNSVSTNGGSGNDLDYDLVNGNVSAYAGAEANRIVGTPVYVSGHGWSAEGKGLYQLDPSSPGYDRAVRIPNFNDAFTGAAPDMGAHETGTPAMKLGVQ